MKKSLQKKLMKYSLTAAAVVAVGVNANAQVYYSGLIDTVTTDTYNIDINNDQINDYSFKVYQKAWTSVTGSGSPRYSYKSASIKAFNNNKWIASTANNYSVKPLAISESVNSSKTWNIETKSKNLGKTNSGMQMSAHNSFISTEEKYIGIKLNLSDGIHYGWIRVYVPAADNTIKIRDWAYEQKPNKRIFVGSTVSFIESVDNINFKISPNPANDLLTINADENYFVEIININGKILKTVQMTEKNAKIDINELQKGLYIAKLTGKENTKTLKFVKE